jgi:hypothetical protein
MDKTEVLISRLTLFFKVDQEVSFQFKIPILERVGVLRFLFEFTSPFPGSTRFYFLGHSGYYFILLVFTVFKVSELLQVLLNGV